MATGFNLTALNDFLDQTNGRVVPKLVFEGYTTSILPVQEGIKGTQTLNIFDTSITVQSGSCVSTPLGQMTATQRSLSVQSRISYDGLCLDDLNPTYLGVTSLDRGSYNQTFQLASVYTDQIVNQMKKADDIWLWGDRSGSAYEGLGHLTSGSNPGVVVPSAATGSFTSANALDKLDALIENVPSDVADRDDLTIWMGIANYRKYITALRNANSYWFDPSVGANRTGIFQSVYPFAGNIKVVATPGITGNRIALMPDAYTIIGTDSLTDVDNFQLFYDIAADQLKHRLKHKLGVQVAFSDYIVSNNG